MVSEVIVTIKAIRAVVIDNGNKLTDDVIKEKIRHSPEARSFREDLIETAEIVIERGDDSDVTNQQQAETRTQELPVVRNEPGKPLPDDRRAQRPDSTK